MRQGDKHSEELKSLLDQWSVDLEQCEQLREDEGRPLMDLKRTLENTWAVFERRFMKSD